MLFEKTLITYVMNKFQVIMELECSLPCTKTVATGPFPNPDNCNPHHLLKPTFKKKVTYSYFLIFS